MEALSGGPSLCYKVAWGIPFPPTPGGDLSYQVQNKILVYTLNLNLFHVTMQT